MTPRDGEAPPDPGGSRIDPEEIPDHDDDVSDDLLPFDVPDGCDPYKARFLDEFEGTRGGREEAGELVDQLRTFSKTGYGATDDRLDRLFALYAPAYGSRELVALRLVDAMAYEFAKVKPKRCSNPFATLKNHLNRGTPKRPTGRSAAPVAAGEKRSHDAW